MKRTLLVLVFFVGNISLLLTTFFLLTTLSGGSVNKFATNNSPKLVASNSPYVSYTAVPEVLGTFTETKIVEADARPQIIDNYLKKYGSPFAGLGEFIVDRADAYQIDYRLIPAIAQCESNVGKVVPFESHNAWGWGIYGNSVLRFKTWEEGIDVVSRGLRENYYNHGLDTPEKIMPKYTPPSQGSWARCVTQFLDELR